MFLNNSQTRASIVRYVRNVSGDGKDTVVVLDAGIHVPNQNTSLRSTSALSLTRCERCAFLICTLHTATLARAIWAQYLISWDLISSHVCGFSLVTKLNGHRSARGENVIASQFIEAQRLKSSKCKRACKWTRTSFGPLDDIRATLPLRLFLRARWAKIRRRITAAFWSCLYVTEE